MGQRPDAVRRNDSGFTLTELLIVIVILGVLSGVVVLAVGQFSHKGEVEACKAAMKTTEVAVESFRANTGRLPANMDDLKPAYLRTEPTTPQYTITVDWTTGTVTGDLTSTAGSPQTPDCSA